MPNLILSLLPWAVLASNIAALVLFVSLIFRDSFGREIATWAGKHALALGLLVSSGAVFGSLFYSNVMGYEPCVLCWWQRLAIYPTFILFLTALFRKDRKVFHYVFPLSLIAAVISTYHSYVQWGGSPLIPCDVEGTCNRLYVYAFGYITIPTMVLSVAVLLILLWWANKIYENRNSR